jgi:hypothetical protein
MKVTELFEEDHQDPLILGLMKRLIDKGEIVTLNIEKKRFPTNTGTLTVFPAHGQLTHVGKDEDRYALMYNLSTSRNPQIWMLSIRDHDPDLDSLLDIKKVGDKEWEVVNAP